MISPGDIKRMRGHANSVLLLLVLALSVPAATRADQPVLVGHWKLAEDTRDYSGNHLDATNHEVNLQTMSFDGQTTYLEIPDSPALDFGRGDFSVTLHVRTQRDVTDTIGDLVSKFDPVQRSGFVLTFKSNSSAYNSVSDARLLYFGTDHGTLPQWSECGRPGGKTHSSDALTVFNGSLYVGTVDAPDEDDWAHVYRYSGGQQWEDCGRVGSDKVPGVYAMVVHDGALYAATAGSHGGPNANKGDFGHVYRYLGGKQWEDVGPPGEHYRVNALASFDGKLYANSIHTGGQSGGPYVYEGNRHWKPHGESPGRLHCLMVHNGKLYGGYPQGEVFEFVDGSWKSLGNPYASLDVCNQIHTMGVYQGELYVGTWPLGKVAIHRNGTWVDVGRLGDATEIVGLVVYNGTFYAGSIPRAEVFRFDGPHRWTSLRRLFDPPDYNATKDVEDWSRASSLTVYQGKLFVSTATCYRAMISHPRPDEVRGKVYSLKVGEGVSYDSDIGAGWKHVAAVRERGELRLFVDGQLVAKEESAEPLDVSSDAPLRIGFGPQSHFLGKIRDVRIYNGALSRQQIAVESNQH